MQGSHLLTGAFCLKTLVLGLLVNTAFACDCDLPPSPQKALQQAAAVFAGQVIQIKTLDKKEYHGDYAMQVQFKVANSWKGVQGTQAVVQTGAEGGADCGFDFKAGQEYLVYAYALPGEKTLITGICSRTRPIDDAVEDLAALGRPVVSGR
ncbi:MAG: hypothetical protein JO316_01065 [Abitibacteriaceae bacterium]|nr:hypothetical protein [Abditibacteriaceae bacterium]MBV9863919.1 hypothetical protein [Abditibacteriaceae bacterium]